MGSPITFSGFNSIDFNLILNAVMAQERAPLTRLETQKKTLETQNTAFGTLAGKLATLETAVEDLKAADSLSLVTATSSGAGVGVSATSGTVTGTYDVVVSSLARAQTTASESTYASFETVIATGGTLTITPNDGGPAIDVTLTGATTLSELADAINAKSDSPAAASVVQTSPGVYRLVLTGKDTGTEKAFTITNGLTGGTGLAFTDTDGNGVSGDSAADNVQNALNASVTVNGLPVTSASNTLSDVVPGATLSLLQADPLSTVTVKVGRDNTGAKDAVNKFVTAYNDLLTFAKDQETAAIAGRASIGRDPLLRSLRGALRSAISAEYAGGSFSRLAEIGIEFETTGKIKLNSTLFEEKLASSSADVQRLLSGTDGNGGAFGAMFTMIEDYTQAGGLVSGVRGRIDDRIRGLSQRMDSMSAQLEIRRLALQREFTAADMAMTRLKSQSAGLQSLGGGFGLF